MILSHRHKFIFIKTNKTAGTSLEIALSAICGDNDIITPISADDEKVRFELSQRGSQNYIIDDNIQFKAHSTAAEIKESIAPEIWNSYFKFCFERNPWDKVVSHYYWQKRHKNYSSVLEYIKAGEFGNIKGLKHYSINGKVAVDKIYKYEEISDAMASITKQLHLATPIQMPDYKAKSQYRKPGTSYAEFLTQKEAELIGVFFAKEIKLLDYKF
jgi:hypothetical protein